MEQRLFGEWSWGRAGRDAIIGLIATSVYLLIGRIVTISLPDVLLIIAPAVIFFVLAFIADLLWARHGFRCATFTFSQRLLAYVVYGLVVSGVVACVILWLLPVVFGISPFGDLTGNTRGAVEGIILAVVVVVTYLACFLLDRVRLTAAQCHTVLRRIVRQWDTGRYKFDHGATRQEIRQESRFLDYLAKHSAGHIKRRRWGYIFTGDSDAEVALKDLCPGVINGNLEKAVACANHHWRQGSWWHNRWSQRGDEAHAVPESPDPEHDYAKELFGSRLDMLFNGGRGYRVRMPKGPGFHLMVIKGRPGAGKSTQALQICATLARQGYYCLYYSLEEERESLLQAAYNFGWADPTADYGGVQHFDAQSLRRRRPARRSTSTAPKAGVWVSSLGDRAMPVTQRKRQLHDEWQLVDQVPRCVIIDSLEGFANVGIDQGTPTGVPRAELLALKDFFRDRCQMLIIVVEDDGSDRPGYEDFVADAVIRLGRAEGQEYTLLVAEVLKVRNQNHALGLHQVKIRSRADIKRATGSVRASMKDLHPGLNVFPSLHYRLFQAQHRPTTADYVLSSGLVGWDQMLPGVGSREGIRRQSALALLGPSGTGKSVLAHNFLLEGVRENTPTLLLLLHNDPATITSHGIPQEAHRMHFSWRSERDVDTDRQMTYHQFEWTLDGIARWCSERQAFSDALSVSNTLDAPDIPAETFSRLLRLPYLFKLKPLKRPITPTDLRDLRGTRISPNDPRRQAYEQAIAVEEFLHTLAKNQPPLDAKGHARWDTSARRALREVFDGAWDRFVQRVGPESLALGVEPAGMPKRIALMNARDDQGVEAPAPFLQWDSRYWEPNKRERMREFFPYQNYPGQPAGRMYDTDLLTIRDFRPGNIAPEDFIARILRDIGEPTEESKYERVVFDDVTQLSQRFPLLASSPLFLPTIIDMFKATGITSLFLADTESGDRDAQDWGIAITADQAIRTRFQYISKGELQARGKYNEREITAEVDALPGDERHAPHVLHVTRIQSRFEPGEEESIVTLDPLPKPNSGNLNPSPSV